MEVWGGGSMGHANIFPARYNGNEGVNQWQLPETAMRVQSGEELTLKYSDGELELSCFKCKSS